MASQDIDMADEADFIPIETCDDGHDESYMDITQELFFRTHNGLEKYAHRCTCGRFFKTSSNRWRHAQQTHHGLRCLCDIPFFSKKDLGVHQSTVKHNLKCAVDGCNKLYRTHRGLMDHQFQDNHHGYVEQADGRQKLHYTESSVFRLIICPCGITTEDFPDVSFAASTMPTGPFGPSITCPCGRSFSDTHSPSATAFPSETKQWKCPTCGESFLRFQSMWQHQVRRHHTCLTCNLVFISEIRLFTHQRSTGHCYCASCDRFFCHFYDHNQHLLDSHAVSPCSRDRTIGSVNPTGELHVPPYRDDRPSIPCTICGHSFAKPGRVWDHRIRIPDPSSADPVQRCDNPFLRLPCPFCGTQKRALSQLLTHLRTCGPSLSDKIQRELFVGGIFSKYIDPAEFARREPTQQFLHETLRSIKRSEKDGVRCPLCEKERKESSKEALRRHLYSAHMPAYIMVPQQLVFPLTKTAAGESTKKAYTEWHAFANFLELAVCAREKGSGEWMEAKRVVEEIAECVVSIKVLQRDGDIQFVCDVGGGERSEVVRRVSSQHRTMDRELGQRPLVDEHMDEG